MPTVCLPGQGAFNDPRGPNPRVRKHLTSSTGRDVNRPRNIKLLHKDQPRICPSLGRRSQRVVDRHLDGYARHPSSKRPAGTFAAGTPPGGSAPAGGGGGPGQSAKDDCEKLKAEIKQLQDLLAQLSVQMQKLKDTLAGLNKAIVDYQESIKSFTKLARAGTWPDEGYLGRRLDRLAGMMNTRRNLEQQIDDLANEIQAIKDMLDEDLNRLGNCGSI